ncbi:hypothetical protein V499_03260 [Pseudogymnoascus sp. VKM F-103]|uniref:Uncharacterized protein n=1 Tax=Pseudogymnoascus verrucosus TaxID=342668 RepID=A0A1B8GT00_9PEZI|nr:uncharacterized protein VE01_02264 [Pseudogymnoascus verrucosus]KFY77277.1 hypothetical protein V499_03260 [Pseudogymnoascus sp. VKM F-103]OBT98945.1 hypothetical protein VE01_02264 [Pseudogymnoascus verrucosus]
MNPNIKVGPQTDPGTFAPKQEDGTTDSNHELDPALKALLDSLQGPHTRSLEAQKGIKTDPENKAKHEADLEDAKREEADIERQIENQFPDLYADGHKLDQEGRPRIRGLQLSRNRFKSSYVIGRIYNKTTNRLNWYWHGLSGHNYRWDIPEPWSIDPGCFGEFKIEIGQLGSMQGKVDYWIDGTERSVLGNSLQGYLSTHFSAHYEKEVSGSAEVYMADGFSTQTKAWGDGGQVDRIEFYLRKEWA